MEIKMARKKYSAEFKAKAALEALKGQRTLNEIAGELGGPPCGPRAVEEAGR